jgi:hypothetical protein
MNNSWDVAVLIRLQDHLMFYDEWDTLSMIFDTIVPGHHSDLLILTLLRNGFMRADKMPEAWNSLRDRMQEYLDKRAKTLLQGL